MSTRTDQAAATRARILDAVSALLREGGFHDASMEAIAERASVTRVTLYRIFGSRQELLQGVAWHLIADARLDRVDAAHAHPDVRTAVREVLRANCEMFDHLADALPLAFELARFDADIEAVIDATYHGRRHRAMETLAARLVKEGAVAPGWTEERIADTLLVLSSHETFQTLVQHRGRSVDEAADFLHHLAKAFLTN